MLTAKSEVFNTDCMEYMRSLPDKYFDIAIADPPYGNADMMSGCKDGRFGGGNTARFYKYRKPDKNNPLAVAWDRPPSEDFFSELSRVSCHQVIWGGNFFNLPPCKCFLVWVKTNIPEKFTMTMCEYAWTSFPRNAKVFHHSSARTENSGRFHPTEKPVALYQWILRYFAQPGFRIFDPMMGSQSSRIAAYSMGYDFVGCELDEEYFRLGCEHFNRICANIVPTSVNTPTQLRLF